MMVANDPEGNSQRKLYLKPLFYKLVQELVITQYRNKIRCKCKILKNYVLFILQLHKMYTSK